MSSRVKDKVLLVTPPYHSGVVESAGRWPNLGFMYIAGELEKAGFQVVIYDAMSKFHDFDRIRSAIRSLVPDFVGVTAITASVNDAVRVLKIVREELPQVTTLLGGVHPTFCYGEILSNCGGVVDYCILGEGEITTVKLLSSLRDGHNPETEPGIAFAREGRIHTTTPRDFVENLDSLTPAWHLVDWNDYPLYFMDDSRVAIVSSSRGCTHTCTFCSQHKFWQGTYRQRSPHSFVAEIEHVAKTHGVNVFFIADEYPTYSRERWVKILDLLIEKQLGIHILLETVAGDILRDRDILHRYREAGVLFIYIGVESTSDRQLQDFKKETRFAESKQALQLIRDAGMIVESSLILGTPGETRDSIRETLTLAREYNADFMHFLFLAPWPYADMYEQLKPYIEVFDYSKYNLVEPVIKPEAMTRDLLLREVLNCYKSYYMKKLPEWAAMKGNELKRSCLIRGMKAIVENSFLKEHMKGLGGMPGHVLKLLDSLNLQPPT